MTRSLPCAVKLQAQRLAATEALIKNAQCHGGLPSSTGYGGDLEARVKRLAAELRLMKERLGDIRPPAQVCHALTELIGSICSADKLFFLRSLAIKCGGVNMPCCQTEHHALGHCVQAGIPAWHETWHDGRAHDSCTL